MTPLPAMTSDLAISVHGLTKSFGDRHAVENLSFDLARGNVTGFVGPNGAGKSTLLSLLAGLRRPDAGQVRLLGRELGDWPSRQRAQQLAWLAPRSKPTPCCCTWAAGRWWTA